MTAMINRKNAALLYAITALGVSSIITQITVTRELLNIFRGNELVLGLIISIWLLLTGIGAAFGRFQKHGKPILVGSLILVAVLPFLHIFIFRFYRNVVAVPGANLDLRQLLLYLPLVLAPYTVISGYLLTLACHRLAESDQRMSIGAVYFIDNIGDILGGVLFSFVLIFITTTFNSLYVPAILTLIAAGFLCAEYRYHKTMIVTVIVLSGVLISWRSELDRASLAWLFPGQNIAAVRESPYGRIVVTKDAEQYNFFENGIPFHASGDNLDAEEHAHFMLSQAPNRNLSVLLVSGGISGVIDEILKYKIKKIDYVELDPEIIAIAKQYTDNLNRDTLTIHTTDARKFIERAGERYDAVIVMLPEPSNLQLNRFYTEEFFRSAKKIMADDGLLCFGLPAGDNYISEELADYYRVIHAAGKRVFRNVSAYPASKTIFVLSDAALSYDIAGLIAQQTIETRYVNSFYLDAMLTADRIAAVNAALAGEAGAIGASMVNRDLHPAAFKLQLDYWLSTSELNRSWIMGAFIAAAILFIILYRPVPAALWTTGFASVSLEIIILMLFQIHSGYIYHQYGIMVTVFMVGLAIGSFVSSRCAPQKTTLLLHLEIILVGYILLFAGLIAATDVWKNDTVLYLLLLAVAMIAGAEFSVAGAMVIGSVGDTASRLYTADFIGAGTGSLLTGVWFIPALGVRNTVLLLLAVKAVSLLKLFKAST